MVTAWLYTGNNSGLDNKYKRLDGRKTNPSTKEGLTTAHKQTNQLEDPTKRTGCRPYAKFEASDSQLTQTRRFSSKPHINKQLL
jgi:hypothetical protein